MRAWFLTAVAMATLSGALLSAPSGLSVGDARIVEGHSGSRSVEVTVSLSPAASGPVTVTYNTRDGLAQASSDYGSATGTVAFAPGEITKKITATIIGDRAPEPDETFEVLLSNPSGASLIDNTGTVTIVNDDFVGYKLSVYEVRLSFAGHTGSMAGTDGCPVRNTGKVVLTGLVAGDEKVPSDDDIEYQGILQLDADVDLCEIHRPTQGKDEFCAIRVIGAGPMKVELSVYADDRGGYVKASKAPGTFLSNLSGSCMQALIAEEQSLYPDGSKANVFNGEALPLPSGPLQVGRYQDGELLVEVLRVVHHP